MSDATNLPEIPDSSMAAADPMRGTCGHVDGVLITVGPDSYCLMCARRTFGPMHTMVRDARRVRREKAAT